MPRSVTLFVPDLLELTEAFKHLAEQDVPPLKNLARFLSRAEKKSVDVNDWHNGLSFLFQLEKFPAATLIYRQANKTKDKNIFYLCADPVYIQPDINSAVLLAHEELELSLADAEELVAAINAHFIDENWSLEVLKPHRWIMKLDQLPSLTTMPLTRLKQQAIGHHLPKGEDSAYWQRIQNEIQMLLFAHPLNEAREAQGKMPVNSLWLWGEGELVEKSPRDWLLIAGKGEMLEALASWCDCEYSTMSINEELLIDTTGQSLLASNEFTLAVQNQDVYAWLEALVQFENNWINNLLKLLTDKKLDTVVLFAGNGMQFTLTRKMLKRWWRRTKPFSSFGLQ